MFSHLFLVTVSKDLTFDDLHSSKELLASYYVHYSISPCLSPISLSNSEKTGYQPPYFYTLIHSQYTCSFRIIICTPVRNNFINHSTVFMYTFVFNFTVSESKYSFPKLFTSSIFLPIPSMRLCHIHFKTLVRFFYYSEFHFEIPQNPG